MAIHFAAANGEPAFSRSSQHCNIYNDGAFDFVRDDKEARRYLEHGAAFADTGIVHDEADLATAFALARVTFETHGVVPLGVFRDVERESYDSLVSAKFANAKGDGNSPRSSLAAHR